MDLSQQPNFSDGQARESRSFHSLSGQPRKISIGILADSFCQNSGPKDVNAKDSLVRVHENVTPSKANSAQDGKWTDRVLYAANQGKQTEVLVQETSPWLSPKSFNQKLPTPEQVRGAEITCILPATGPVTETHHVLHLPRPPPANFSAHYFDNHMSGLESSNGSQRKFDGDMPGMRDITGEGFEKLSFTTIQKVATEKDVGGYEATKEETRGSETLRMKLWEILGTISSPNEQHPNDCDLGMEAKNMKLVQKSDAECKPVVKPTQNSDTIESDSEGHGRPVRRPRKRSLIRNGASNKLKAAKSNDAQLTRYMKDNQEKYACFEEVLSRRQHYSATGGTLAVMRKKSEKWSTGIKSRMMRFNEHENPGHDEKVNNRGERRPALQNSMMHGDEVGDKNETFKRIKKDSTEPKKVSLEISSQKVHVEGVSEHPRNDVDGPKLQKDVDLQQDVGYALLKSTSEQKFDIPCPAFGEKTPREIFPDLPPSEMRIHATRSTPGSPPETKLGEADDDSPPKLVSNTEGIRRFKSFLASKLTCDKSNSKSNSSDGPGGLEDFSYMKPRPIVEDPGSRLSSSSSEGSDSETLKEDSLPSAQSKSLGESELFPEVGTVKKPDFVLHLNKKHQYQETIEVSGFSPTSFSRKGIEDYGNVQQHLELHQGDGLASAVTLFALALERVKIRMKSVIRKRSAEILTSVAEGIHMQLQTAESQIQADMGKLTSLTKSKRKHLEMRFQELQGQLNVIYAKFKEEVHQHLQDCRDTVECLDANHMELRGIVEKQSASHRKLLLQAEEEIETHLTDAGRRIMKVHTLAREQMLQLKNAVVDCLNEGNLG
ncbi:meiosis-specific protein ASY3-like [Coffea arabica]|uniref:Meiosis-specific protein ASY3-like n=1 Tax=Coffea arabica TaxID=13443 RepID=A0ABM4VST5_COFAR